MTPSRAVALFEGRLQGCPHLVPSVFGALRGASRAGQGRSHTPRRGCNPVAGEERPCAHGSPSGDAPPALEFEQLGKGLLAEFGSKAYALAILAGTRAWVQERNEENAAAAQACAAGEGLFSTGPAQVLLARAFFTDFRRHGWAVD